MPTFNQLKESRRVADGLSKINTHDDINFTGKVVGKLVYDKENDEMKFIPIGEKPITIHNNIF
jgi:hypothetical protein